MIVNFKRMSKISLVILAPIIICATIYTLSRYIYTEHFENNIIFVDNDYMKNVIYSDPFFSRMTYADLVARKSTDKDYKEHYLSNIVEFTKEEKIYIAKMVKQVDDIPNILPGFHSIPWKFAKVNNNIENGWPHTLKDVIVFTNKNVTSSLATYIHEKIHVYQRLFPEETKLYVSHMGYTRYCSRYDNIIELPRNNPDIDDYIYKYNTNGYFYMKYNSPNPSSLEDSHIKSVGGNSSSSYEHPFEAMAYFVSKKFS